MSDANPFGSADPNGASAVGSAATSPSPDPSLLGTSANSGGSGGGLRTPAPTPASSSVSPLAASMSGESSSGAGLKGVVGSGTISYPPTAAAPTADVKSAPAAAAAAADGTGRRPSHGAGSSGAGATNKADRRVVADMWRRQTEWKNAQSVVTHKVTVAVETQNKKVHVFKCTFKPLPVPAVAAAAGGKENEKQQKDASAGPEVTVFRRYDDLVWLRATVMKMFPGIWFCNLVGKGFMTSVDEKFLNERRDDAERLLTQLVSVGTGVPGMVTTCDPFVQFMSVASVDGFDKVRKEVESRLKARPWIDDALKAYGIHFAAYMATPAQDAKSDEQVGQWLAFLKEQEAKIEKCIEVSAALEATNAQLVVHGTKMAVSLDAVAKHEDTTKSRCTPARVETTSKFVPWMDANKQCAAGFGPSLTVNFRRELTDLKAFQDVLNTRNDLLKASNSAKKSAAPWKLPPAKPYTDKQLAQKAIDLKAEIDTAAIVEAVNKLVLSQQTKLFWIEKSQIKALDALAPTWKKLQDEASVEVSLLA